MNGGIERSNIEIAKLLKKNYEIHFLSLKFTSHYLNEIKENNIKIHHMKSNRLMFSIREYINLIKEINPSLIISLQTYTNVFCLIINYFFLPKFKIVCSERLSLETLKFSNKGKLILLLYKLFYRYASGIICISNGLKKEIEINLGKNIKNLKVIYNPTFRKDLTKLSKKKNNYIFKKKKFKYILSIGRFEKVKNHLMQLKAAMILKKKLNFKLILIGDGSEKKQIIQFIKKNGLKNNVDLINFTKNPYPFFRGADLIINTSNFEGLCNVIIESIFLRKYIISTDCPVGPRELITNKKVGSLIRKYDYEALASKIVKYFKLKKNKKNYPKTLKNKLDVSKIKKSYNQYIFNIIKQ